MACHRSTVTFLSLLVLHGFHLQACNGARVGPQEAERNTTEFIRSSCGATRFPSLCYSSLSTYASTIQTSPTQLATTALVVTLSGARNASSAIEKTRGGGRMPPRVAAAMADCVENLADSVGQLKESLAAMGRLPDAAGKRLAYQINSVQTWVSAALTDDDTCMDEFAGAAMNGEVKVIVRSHVVKVAQLTSNALSLVSGLASSLSPP